MDVCINHKELFMYVWMDKHGGKKIVNRDKWVQR